MSYNNDEIEFSINELEDSLSSKTKKELKNRGTNLTDYIYNYFYETKYDDNENEVIFKNIAREYIELLDKKSDFVCNRVKSSIEVLIENHYLLRFENDMIEISKGNFEDFDYLIKKIENEKKGFIKNFFSDVVEYTRFEILLNDKKWLKARLKEDMSILNKKDNLFSSIIIDIIINNEKAHNLFKNEAFERKIRYENKLAIEIMKRKNFF